MAAQEQDDVVEFRWHCLCGAAWQGVIRRSLLDLFACEWEAIHRGQGHGRTDARTAERARSKGRVRKADA